MKYFKYRNSNMRNQDVKLGKGKYFVNNFNQIAVSDKEEGEMIKKVYKGLLDEIPEKDYKKQTPPAHSLKPEELNDLAAELENREIKVKELEAKLLDQEEKLAKKEIELAEKETTLKNKQTELDNLQLSVNKVLFLQKTKNESVDTFVAELKKMKVEELKDMAAKAGLPEEEWKDLTKDPLVKYLSTKF